MPNVYTRTGDKGTTGLFGGSRTEKDDIRVDAYGTMDEANSAIGVAYSLVKDQDIKEILHFIQGRIFALGAELASDEKGRKMLSDVVSQDDIEYMEKTMDHYLAIIGKQKEFIIPGRSPASSALHLARAIVRRGERTIVTYRKQDETVRPEVEKFVNRLSDLLFVLARVEEFEEDIRDDAKSILEKNNTAEGAPETLKTDDSEELLLTLAKRIAAGSRVKAQELGVPIVFSAVDIGGNLAYYERMHNSLLASINISQNKAYTANALKCPTEDVQDLAKENSPLFGIQFTNDNRIVTFGGGYPLIVDGKQIGAIGVSGGTADEDMAIAKAGLAVLETE